jgi:hypothetical protein
VSNYIPVSLLTPFSKILEMAMQMRILQHLTECNILSTEQYGFRIGLKTDNAIYKLTTEILNAVNKVPETNSEIYKKTRRLEPTSEKTTVGINRSKYSLS